MTAHRPRPRWEGAYGRKHLRLARGREAAVKHLRVIGGKTGIAPVLDVTEGRIEVAAMAPASVVRVDR
ncbi:MAG TPA: hypothetical protein VMU49_08325 [Candidatus Acidoferrales bacterium]|nr:hypothetical protein [Candidatus Acidoferrales bacterium]